MICVDQAIFECVAHGAVISCVLSFGTITMTTPTNILYLTTTIIFILETLAKSDIEKVKHGVSYSPIYTSWDSRVTPRAGPLDAKWWHHTGYREQCQGFI
jgi:hypothetical protein